MATKQPVAKIFKYIGFRTNNFGRPLWEIVLNLKKFGIGRYVIRKSLYDRYPEPTFYKILSVQPEVIEYPEPMKGDLWTEITYRGKIKNEPVNLGRTAWKDDYQLIHKHDEFLLTAGKPLRLKPTLIHPKTAPLPPLWKEILRREKLAQGLPIDPNEPEHEIELLYCQGTNSFIRIAEEGEEPSHKTGPGNFMTNNSPLYDDIIWNREEADAKYNHLKPIYPTKGHDKFQLPDV